MEKQFDFTTKFKDRLPQETVKIIKTFFKDLGYNIVVEKLTLSEVGTFTCFIRLKYNNKFIGFGNGKGLSKDFALASAYAELYERFCSTFTLLNNQLFFNKYKELNLNQYPLLDYKNDLADFRESKVLNTLCSTWFNGEVSTEEICNTALDNDYLSIVFKNILDKNDIKYFDERLINIINDSTGLAAGNTFKEAFIQGFSEILERYVSYDFYPFSTAPISIIDYTIIKNTHLLTIILNILLKNNKLYIMDLSTIYNLPVIGVLIINSVSHRSSINFGSFPIFDIALERCLTEMWQGFYSIEEATNFQVPLKSIDKLLFKTEYCDHGFSHTAVLPDNFFNRLEIVNDYNHDIFKNIAANEDELFNYYIELIKINNFNVFWHNFSLIPEMWSIRIFCDSLIIDEKNSIHLYKDSWLIIKELIRTHFKPKQDILLCHNKDIEIITKLHWQALCHSKHKGKYVNEIYCKLLYRCLNDFFTHSGIIPSRLLFKENILDIYKIPRLDLTSYFIDSIYFDQIKKYCLISDYINTNKYSKLEILEILKALGFDVEISDILNYNNNDYLYNKIYIDTLINTYSSNEYEQFVKSFIGVNNNV